MDNAMGPSDPINTLPSMRHGTGVASTGVLHHPFHLLPEGMITGSVTRLPVLPPSFTAHHSV